MPNNVPIMTCGDSKPDAMGVHAGMKPDYEVIYAGFSLVETLQEVPEILAGRPPPAESLHTQVAANNFDRRPVAVICGGGYNDEAFAKLRDASIEAAGSKRQLGVAFFRCDNDLTEKLYAEGKGPKKKGEGYAKAVAARLRARLEDVGVETGLREEDVGELFWY